MRTGVPVTQACHSCGFGDYSSFYRAFKKEFGLSPRAYRKTRKTDIVEGHRPPVLDSPESH
jgi:AraC-like DNA-binding protein